MRIAIALFDRFAPLDAVGPYEVLHRIDGVDVVLTAEQPGPVRDNAGTLALTADAAFTDVPAPDVVLVPGGPGQREHMADGPLHRWLRTADATSTYTTGVCTGTLVLAAAGLLSGRRAPHRPNWSRICAAPAGSTPDSPDRHRPAHAPRTDRHRGSSPVSTSRHPPSGCS